MNLIWLNVWREGETAAADILLGEIRRGCLGAVRRPGLLERVRGSKA